MPLQVSPSARATSIRGATPRHAAAFAIIDRDAYIPNFFGFPFNGESVAFRAPVVELTKLIDKGNTILDPDDPVEWSGRRHG